MDTCKWRRNCKGDATVYTSGGGLMCEPHAVEYYDDQLGGRRHAVEFFAKRAARQVLEEMIAVADAELEMIAVVDAELETVTADSDDG